MSYPFEKSKIPVNKRIEVEHVNSIFKDAYSSIFPDIISSQCVISAGTSLEDWDDLYHTTNIYCCDNKIQKMIFIWDDESFEYDVVNCQELFTRIPCNFSEYLLGKYNIGFTMSPTCTPRAELQKYAGINIPIQIFLSETAISKSIPKLSSSNPSCIDLIKYRQIRLYCHSSLAFNISRPNEYSYIGNLLSYASAHGVKGVVFHVGKHVKMSKDEALKNMFENIILGIRSKQNLTSKFLLETSSGQGTELLSTAEELYGFFLELMKIPDVYPHIGICVDTCHIWQANGYYPNMYIKKLLDLGLPVDFVHFNDSLRPAKNKIDRHAVPGTGTIPWIILEKTAILCNQKNIDMVQEW